MRDRTNFNLGHSYRDSEKWLSWQRVHVCYGIIQKGEGRGERRRVYLWANVYMQSWQHELATYNEVRVPAANLPRMVQHSLFIVISFYALHGNEACIYIYSCKYK